jgi:hypothetical protein
VEAGYQRGCVYDLVRKIHAIRYIRIP